METIHVSSEIGPLKRVIVHRPDKGIGRVRPRSSDELLFDDIVFFPEIQSEHDVFTSVMKKFIGTQNVLFAENLLLEALDANQEAQEEIILKILDYEELPSTYIETLCGLDNQSLADALITGYLESEDLILFDPIPNFIFTRDLGATINDHVVITKAAKEARFRENFLARFIFWAHPLFESIRSQDRIINLNNIDRFPPSRRGEPVSIEGGDMMLINPDYLLIGNSERTTEHAIHTLRDELFRRKVVKNVVQINIPKDRSFMHIDTIYTMIREDHIICFRPLVYDGLSSYVIVYKNDGSQQIYHSIKDFMLAEINPEMQFIFCGDGLTPYQEREQWTDGCNLVALKPGVAIAYNRNLKTEIALQRYGYQIISAQEFLTGPLDAKDLENTIIKIPSNELSRARGGSHCMTFPIWREG